MTELPIFIIPSQTGIHRKHRRIPRKRKSPQEFLLDRSRSDSGKFSSCTGMRMEWNTGIITEQAPVFMTNTETGHL